MYEEGVIMTPEEKTFEILCDLVVENASLIYNARKTGSTDHIKETAEDAYQRILEAFDMRTEWK